MNYLFVINEYFSNGYTSYVLNVFSFFIILFGLFVIIVKNPVISILFLIGLFSGVASYLILLGMSFIGLSYIIVYIGAVSILFLFILMLINIRVSELKSNSNNSIPLGIVVGVLFIYLLFPLLPYDITTYNIYDNIINIYNRNNKYNHNFNNIKIDNNDVVFVTSNTWDGNLTEVDHITSIGNIMYTNYNLWLIIASYIILLAMVGSIVITIKQKN